MRPSALFLTLLLAALVVGRPQPTSAVELRQVVGRASLLPGRVCALATCEFSDRAGTNLYRISDGLLRRISGKKEPYQRQLTGKFEKVLLAAISQESNLLAVVIARERVNQRGRSLSSPSPTSMAAQSMPHPSDVDREHQLQLINPKSGTEVKALDLGAFRPEDLALSESGEWVLIVGRDLQLKTRELRVLNARSGKLEHQQTLDSKAKAEVAANGFRLGDETWQLHPEKAGGVRHFLSTNPFSIAEFSAECSGVLAGPRFASKTIAVPKVQGAKTELDQMLGSNLAVALRKAGLNVLERQNLEQVLDEQWLRTTGLTAEDQGATLGKIGSPSYLAFGSLEIVGTTFAINVRLVEVETSAVVSSCQLTCRDCREDEYVEGVRFLVKAWTEE